MATEKATGADRAPRAAVLPGMEAGRRTERTEWGLRHLDDRPGIHRKGDVGTRASEQHARESIGTPGWGPVEIVSRTVVTYTTTWQRAS